MVENQRCLATKAVSPRTKGISGQVTYMFIKKRHSVHKSMIAIKPKVIDDEENWEKKPEVYVVHLGDNCWYDVEHRCYATRRKNSRI